MKILTKAIAAIMLAVAMICVAGCKKDPKIYNVNVSASPSVGGVVTGNGAYEEGRSCTVTATANSEYTFEKWVENGATVSTNANYTFCVTSNCNLVAHFNQHAYTISVSAEPAEGGSITGGGNYFLGDECTVEAVANDGYLFVNWTENDVVVSTNANYTFSVVDNRTLVVHFDHAYVDLGLPSGTLWATCNIGANAPEDYGDYFAWGETETKDAYNWSTYKWCNGDYNQLTKYCNNSSYGYEGFTDDLAVLLPEDDAATANWGGDWCMPTGEEWNELLHNTTSTWTTLNEVYGRLFTASNGASLFLPAAGCRWDFEIDYVSNYGYYWSSSLLPGGSSEAWYHYFFSDCCSMNLGSRHCGLSVRAVLHDSQN